ncbi:hypothetical protein [Ruminococcus albus]|uniref:Uncharacterized protein n=1 Tax=Ruminococcus albus 8 TaxID=246199 RepID=E9SEU9_RUMAL|nr:hypothetical protein [Ruminococcus albus]EGC02215.1 hypothetical protein CUS_4837 [Ruminococcus albus 8]MCC3351850.1 hypothetical protein [Ruminococcus albus 8]
MFGRYYREKDPDHNYDEPDLDNLQMRCCSCSKRFGFEEFYQDTDTGSYICSRCAKEMAEDPMLVFADIAFLKKLMAENGADVSEGSDNEVLTKYKELPEEVRYDICCLTDELDFSSWADKAMEENAYEKAEELLDYKEYRCDRIFAEMRDTGKSYCDVVYG